MKFIELAKERYSVRSYTGQKIEKEKLDLILEAGRVASTACNNQPQRILVIQSEEGLQKLAKSAPSKMFNAPCILLVCVDKRETWIKPYDGKNSGDIDVSIVTDHMMLQAQELGLGSVWVCYFDSQMIREEFHLPEYIEPINALVIGYTNEDPQSTTRHNYARKALTETVFHEEYVE